MFLISSIGSLHLHIEEHADLAYAKVEGIDLPTGPLPAMPEATFVGCRFDPAALFPDNMAGAVFADCKMAGLRLQNCSLFGVQFLRCDLTGTRFENCDLSAVQFTGCLMDGTAFPGCDMDTASFDAASCAPTRGHAAAA